MSAAGAGPVGAVLGLDGKAALVVGGGFGIGRAVARMLSALGVRLALIDLDGERATAVAAKLSALAIRADVREPGAARAALLRSEEQLGGLDILVNVVGRGVAAPAAEVSAALQREALETNFLHHVEFCSAFAAAARARGRGGAITLVSSLAGVVPFPGQAAYGAAKAALNSYTMNLAVELGPHGIRVNTVAPGIVRTDRNPRDGDTDQELARAIPLGRFAEQDEVATMVVVVSSAAASYLTGQTVVLDGGAGMTTGFWRPPPLDKP
ncbi:SDR family oxidoreductase [Streptosporangium sp. NPDC002544]|uniref:SDR family NAD(P)-dependent oxidoreductase n=1 Tax=Streptosporangium sp. NPDC002544 TaxID=3154538 RepID=UPI00332FF831